MLIRLILLKKLHINQNAWIIRNTFFNMKSVSFHSGVVEESIVVKNITYKIYKK